MMKLISLLLTPIICALPAVSQQITLTPQNIDEVVKAMTLEEKAALLIGGGNKGFIGQNSTIGATESLVPGAAGTTVAITRLGITPLCSLTVRQESGYLRPEKMIQPHIMPPDFRLARLSLVHGIQILSNLLVKP